MLKIGVKIEISANRSVLGEGVICRPCRRYMSERVRDKVYRVITITLIGDK